MIAWLQKSQLVKILITILTFVLVLATACSTPTPTPQPPTSFSYFVQVQAKDTSKEISEAEVTIQVSGMASLDAIADSKGMARIFVDSSYTGQPGFLIVEAKDYERYTQNIDVVQGALPDVVRLKPVSTDVETSDEFTVEPTEEIIAQTTEESTVEPTEELTSKSPSPETPPTEPPEELTIEPTKEPSVEPTLEPTTEPTIEPTTESNPKPSLPGSEMIRPIDGAEMVYVSAGTLTMGSDDSGPNAKGDEFPAHPVHLDAFWIDKYEVTIAQYQKCVDKGQCRAIHLDNPEFVDFYDLQKPMIQVEWNDAKTYCQWAGGDLPSETQWEKAARGTDGYLYPWGNTFDGSRANYCDESCGQSHSDKSANDGYGLTAPVGQYPLGKSAYGAYDMAGNVWEWVDDWYQGYPNTTYQTNEFGEIFKVVRGGSWYDKKVDLRSTYRGKFEPDVVNLNVGFRCIRPVTVVI